MPEMACDILTEIKFLYDLTTGEIVSVLSVVSTKMACWIPKKLRARRRGLGSYSGRK